MNFKRTMLREGDTIDLRAVLGGKRVDVRGTITKITPRRLEVEDHAGNRLTVTDGTYLGCNPVHLNPAPARPRDGARIPVTSPARSRLDPNTVLRP